MGSPLAILDTIELGRQVLIGQASLLRNKVHQFILHIVIFANKFRKVTAKALLKPIETVSGDFYWFDRVGDKIVVCCADSSGNP